MTACYFHGILQNRVFIQLVFDHCIMRFSITLARRRKC